MAILKIQPLNVGGNAVTNSQVTQSSANTVYTNVRIVMVSCTDSFGTITAAGYLNNNAAGFQVNAGDFFFIAYGTTSSTTGLFSPSIDATTGIVTLSATGAGNTVLTTAITTPDVASNLIAFNVSCDQSSLASGGSATLYASSGSKQYRILALYQNSNGTNFSGGSGNRLGSVTDGTTVYSAIPAAAMQSLSDARWGDTALPFPTIALNTLTVAGASLVLKYSGGTTDYTAGNITLTGLLQRVV